MGQSKWKCIGECEKEFSVREGFECAPGVQHVVEEKTYYLADAPHLDRELDPDGLAFRSARTQVHNVPPERKMIDPQTGSSRVVAGGYVTFTKGKYATSDPEQQFYLERLGIDVGYDRWFQVYHTPLQKQRIKDQQLKEREKELEGKLAEANTLLARVQSKSKPEMLAAK